MAEIEPKRLKESQESKDKVETLFKEVITLLEELDENEAVTFAEWILTKAELRYGEDKKHHFPIFRSGIYWAHLGVNIGSEEDKHRPVLIIRSEKKSTVCTVVPLTTQRLNDGYWYHIDLENHNNTAMVEQIRVISKNRIDKPVRISGKIISASEEDMDKITKEIKRMYGTMPKKKTDKQQ